MLEVEEENTSEITDSLKAIGRSDEDNRRQQIRFKPIGWCLERIVIFKPIGCR